MTTLDTSFMISVPAELREIKGEIERLAMSAAQTIIRFTDDSNVTHIERFESLEQRPGRQAEYLINGYGVTEDEYMHIQSIIAGLPNFHS